MAKQKGFKPCCPKCGSIKVRVDAKTGICQEKDCGVVDAASRFNPVNQISQLAETSNEFRQAVWNDSEQPKRKPGAE